MSTVLTERLATLEGLQSQFDGMSETVAQFQATTESGTAEAEELLAIKSLVRA